MNSAVEMPGTPISWMGAVHAEAAPARLFEPFVDEHVVARFLQITPRRVLEMARKKQIPAHPLGQTRKTWRFRMSEIDAHFSAPVSNNPHATMTAAVPGTQERKRLG